MFDSLLTPTVLIDYDKLAGNIDRMQSVCTANNVQLWPHIKTHKMIEVAKMQLAQGAHGLVCAKLSEAEAMLPSGATRMLIANALVDVRLAGRLRALSDSLEELRLAVTSRPQAEALHVLLTKANLHCPVMVAIDTGLGREGARTLDDALDLLTYVKQCTTMKLYGLYTHEGHTYGSDPSHTESQIDEVMSKLTSIKEAAGEDLELWPGCSVTGNRMATRPGVTAVRTGTYVFGDLSLAAKHQVMEWGHLAATILATVTDRPEPSLAHFDSGSKTLSGDRTAEGVYASTHDRRDIHITRCSEEHGWATGGDVNQLRIGERLRLVPAHICPAINLTDTVQVVRGDSVIDSWRVAARGKVQ